MNITGFGLYAAYEDPTVNGGATGLNLRSGGLTQYSLKARCVGCSPCYLAQAFYSSPSPSAANSGTVVTFFLAGCYGWSSLE